MIKDPLQTVIELQGEFIPPVNMLTAQEESFCRDFIESNNAAQAYRSNYDCRIVDNAHVWRAARELRTKPKILVRIRELEREATLVTLTTARQLLQDWVDIANADPNEIVRVERGACRHCYGREYRYQWLNENEVAVAITEALNKDKPIPDVSGGMNYDPKAPPALECPYCFGEGMAQVHIADTTRLSPQTRKLYKGAKMNRWGEIEVLMHDQQMARESIAKMFGVFKEGAGASLNPPEAPKAIAREASPEEAQAAYLRMARNR
jgi:phage terminase small subunit